MSLHRRLTVLEALAEEVRTRPIRRMVEDLAREWRLPPREEAEVLDQAIAEADRLAEERDRLLRAGVSQRGIRQRYADELGLTLAELEAECETISARYYT